MKRQEKRVPCEEFLDLPGGGEVRCALGRGHETDHRVETFVHKKEWIDGRHVEVATIVKYRWRNLAHRKNCPCEDCRNPGWARNVAIYGGDPSL